MGTCRGCRFWNGATDMAAMCFAIKGQEGRWYDVPAGRASFWADAPDQNGPYLMTRPDFGCTLFEAGKPEFFGDDGERAQMEGR